MSKVCILLILVFCTILEIILQSNAISKRSALGTISAKKWRTSKEAYAKDNGISVPGEQIIDITKICIPDTF